VTFQLPDPDKLVEVFGAFDLTLVSMARDALESVEIESFTFDEHASHMGYGGGRYVPARLMVYADKADDARQCLRDLGFLKWRFVSLSSPSVRRTDALLS
jgi:putative signal transducing protein